MKETFTMVAKTFQGLEDVLLEELVALGAENAEAGVRMVTFEGDLKLLYKANLCCRTALRILKPITKFTATDTDELYDFIRDFEWEKYLSPDKTFAIDSTINGTEFTHSKFVTYRVKDGIVDHFNDIYGRRPSIRLSGADLCLNVHINGNRVTISIDSSGEPLNKRGYRVESTEAPINEVLAAGIILKTGWKGESNFIDPMCGSGTFLIEAALIAANIMPGVFRQYYAFEKWPDFDKDLLEELYNDDSMERDFNFKILGGDISAEAVAIARKNIKAAGVDNLIELSCRPFEEWTEAPADGILVTNPPYGERISVDDMTGLYKSIGNTLKRVFKGYSAWILGYKDEHFHEIGLKPSVKFQILNGNLECELREYVLFEGKYNDFKSAGGSVHNAEFNRESRPKVRHLSDDEWKKETKKYGTTEYPKSRNNRKNESRDNRSNDRRNSKKFSDKRNNRRFDDKKAYPQKENKFEANKSHKSSLKPKTKSDGSLTRKAIEITNKGPQLPESSATIFSNVPMRSRRTGWRRQSEETSENE